jgi:hypothetical protein
VDLTQLTDRWLEPWEPVSEPRATSLANTLAAELAASHALHGRPARAIGASSDSDDVLFLIGDPEQLVVVHLTYQKQTEAQWPLCMVFDSVVSFVDGCMQPDHLEYVDDE